MSSLPRKIKFLILICALLPTMGISRGLNEKFSYENEEISFKESVSLEPNDYLELNVTITPENSSLTLIVDNFKSGKIWGLFFEPRSNYYREKKRIPDPRIFCGFHVLIGEQLFVSVDYYGVAHLTDLDGDYVIAIFNLNSIRSHLDFDLISINKIVGQTGRINAPNQLDFLSIFPSLFMFAILTIGIYFIINKIDSKYFNRQSSEDSSLKNESK